MASKNIQINNFNRAKEFYPLIMSYTTSLHGLIDLLSRRTVDMVNKNIPINFQIKEDDILKTFIGAQKTPQISPLALRSDFQDNSIQINLEEIGEEVFTEYPYLFNSGLGEYPARMLLLSAYEIKKEVMEKENFKQDKIWQFLRHCRNASAHNGYFFFEKNEPKYESSWGNLKIDKSMQGKKLFKTKETDGFLSIGDPIRLLWDIEQKFL
jgi:hypothetical protein